MLTKTVSIVGAGPAIEPRPKLRSQRWACYTRLRDL